MARLGSIHPSPCGTTLVVLAIMVLALPAVAQERREPSPPGVTDSVIQRGSVVFRGSARCDVCHGADARGTEDGPDLTDDKWLRGEGTFDQILERVLYGTPRRDAKTGKPMPMRGWEPVSGDDARAVAAYVWSLSRQRAP
ncbi:MAG: cytochrome c [Gemmatimonadota bacterium]|nr:cytochrome c [Gemmatimonadota bacterium]MDH3366853.1 cytochrome c [Gemmatimonadota bacterium]MDH3478594.1 cytochrome c [Gemmatimonadota bacterium]MDH3571565.1 cytochrome c [Gemmatimonadota bacterium]MDH5548360.1 cytochrome c [Gemmatimonadota bacterium]